MRQTEKTLTNYYKTFSGTDTIAFILLPGCKPVALGQLTTISYSMFRIKRPVLNVGRTNVSGMTRGSRVYAGTMIFTMINEHWLAALADELDWIKGYETDIKCDELPMFDLFLVSANEYGAYVNMFISGVDFTDEQQTLSVEDMFTENVFQFIARDVFTYHAMKVHIKKGENFHNYFMSPYNAVKGDNYGFFVLGSSNASNDDLINGYNENAKAKQAALRSNTKPSLTRDLYLKNGIPMTGSDVLSVQNMLTDMGYSPSTNGTFDDSTKNAVKMFQSKIGIPIDGKVNIQTYNAMVNNLSLPPNISYYGSVVNKSGANVYAKPDINSDIVDTYSYNEMIPIYGEVNA